jgi:hypothetical protein
VSKHRKLPPVGRTREQVAGVEIRHLERIMWVMREKYPKVLAANRFFEEETGIHNELGANNLNDALSHLGTLFEQAASMTTEEQAHEVHDFEGHLRRGMMESYEQIFRIRMGEVEQLWEKHERLARPLQLDDKLPGVPSLAELDRLRRRCKRLLDDGRAAKRGHDWDAWEKGTEALVEACQTASKLAAAIDQGIAAADERRRSRRGLRVSLVVGVIVAVLAVPAGYFFNELLQDDAPRVMVPEVGGDAPVDASQLLVNAGLRFRFAARDPTATGCLVVDQSPRAGEEVGSGTVVTLRVRCR